MADPVNKKERKQVKYGKRHIYIQGFRALCLMVDLLDILDFWKKKTFKCCHFVLGNYVNTFKIANLVESG